MKGALVVALLVGLAAPAHAQLVVTDPGNLAKAALIAAHTQQEYTKLLEQLATLTRMSQRLPGMDRYALPALAGTRYDVSQAPYAAALLQGLNTGDARGELYTQSTRQVGPTAAVLAAMSPSVRRATEVALATIELTDSVEQRSIHQVAQTRGFGGTIASAIAAFQEDVTGSRTALHYMTAVLDKLAGGDLIGRRQDTVTNQLQSNTLEQLLVQGKRKRDTEVDAVNMQLMGLAYGADYSQALVAGSADDLRTWRQP